MVVPVPPQPATPVQKTKFNLSQIRFWIKQITGSKIFVVPLLVLLLLLLILAGQKTKLGTRIKNRARSARTTIHTNLCSSLASGVPQKELSPEQKSKFGELASGPPRCGDLLKITDAETGGKLTPDSPAIKVEAPGFSASECDRAEITLRLVKDSQVAWEKKEVDSSCSVSPEGRPNGSYLISLAKPGKGLPLKGAELEACFDLVNKSGERASQNPTSSCEILAFLPYLCQKIPIPNAWR